MIEQLRKDLMDDEGFSLKTYLCTSDKLTIGIGRNLEDKGISFSEAEMFLNNNSDRRERILHKYDVNSMIPLKFVEIILKDIEKYGITKEEAFYLFDNDVNDCISDLRKSLPWVLTKSENVQRVVLNMLFNMGIVRLLKFEEFLRFLKDDNYEMASEEMLDSVWAKKQCKRRAVRLSNIIKNEKI